MENTIAHAQDKMYRYLKDLILMYRGEFYKESSEIDSFKIEINNFEDSDGLKDLIADMRKVLYDTKVAEQKAKDKVYGKTSEKSSCTAE